MKSRYTLAIDARHIALIRRDRHQFFVEHLRTVEPHVKPLDILKPILNRKKALIVSGLEAQEVILRRIRLKLKTRREILAALPFQMEEHFPFPQEELVSIPTLHIEKSESFVDILATHRKTLDFHIETLKEKEVDPDVISADPVALFRFAEFLYPRQASLLIYEPKKRILAAMKDHALVAFQVVPEGEFERALAYFRKKFPAIEQLLSIGTPPSTLPLQCLRVENEEWIPYATAIGLALDAAKNNPQSRQFLSGTHRSKRKVFQEKKAIASFFALCCIFCITLLSLSHRFFDSDRKSLMQALNLSANASFSEVAAKLEPSVKTCEKVPIVPTHLPRLHEILSWLSTHPELQKGITINRLRYQITKCPRLGTKSKSSEGKLEIEYSADLPRVARTFHEALKKDSQFVDKRHEIQFSADQGFYRISFHMKRGSQ